MFIQRSQVDVNLIPIHCRFGHVSRQTTLNKFFKSENEQINLRWIFFLHFPYFWKGFARISTERIARATFPALFVTLTPGAWNSTRFSIAIDGIKQPEYNARRFKQSSYSRSDWIWISSRKFDRYYFFKYRNEIELINDNDKLTRKTAEASLIPLEDIVHRRHSQNYKYHTSCGINRSLMAVITSVCIQVCVTDTWFIGLLELSCIQVKETSWSKYFMGCSI